jgi:hypothetical protein
MGFLHYMFLPIHQAWYVGAFWSNQVQWALVTLPSLLFLLWRIEKHHREHMKELRNISKE